MSCGEARKQLSPFLDGQLSAEESVALSAHLDECAACSQELNDYKAMSELTAEATTQLPPNLWDRIQESREEHGDVREAIGNTGFTPFRPKLSRRFLVGLTAVIVVGAVAIIFGPHLMHDHDEMAVNFDHYLDAYAKDPDQAAAMLFSHYPAEEVSLDDAARAVGYRPVIANGLPAGYSVVSTHVLKMPCCTCVKTICRDAQGQSFVIFEHDAEQPVWFGDRKTSKCDCGGVSTSVVEFDGQIAGTWRVGKRSVTLVGVRDIEELASLIPSMTEEPARS